MSWLSLPLTSCCTHYRHMEMHTQMHTGTDTRTHRHAHRDMHTQAHKHAQADAETYALAGSFLFSWEAPTPSGGLSLPHPG